MIQEHHLGISLMAEYMYVLLICLSRFLKQQNKKLIFSVKKIISKYDVMLHYLLFRISVLFYTYT